MKRGKFYKDVPKDPKQNMRYRLKLLKAAIGDKGLQRAIKEICKHDLLWFCNVMGFVYEPRTAEDLPFITYPQFQDDILWELDECIVWPELGLTKPQDALHDKSRGMGFTWDMAYIYVRRFLFQERFAGGVVSRTEDAVDKTDDPDTIMWKMEYAIENLPRWMRPRNWPRGRVRLRMTNAEMGSTIVGYAMTGDVSRGGRKTCFFVDEAASPHQPGDDYKAYNNLQHVTNTRILGTTPKGAVGVFYDMMHNDDFPGKKLRSHWSEHPVFNRGLYTSHEKGGRWHVVKLDKDYNWAKEHPDGYDFVEDGKTRSPWYDLQCKRASSQQWINQELDIDYLGSGSPFFELGKIAKLQKECSDPWVRMNIWLTGGVPGVSETQRGKLWLWCDLKESSETPAVVGSDPHVVSADIAAGGGGDMSSNSAITVVNRRTGQKVAEYICHETYPQELAEIAVALCKIFNGAFLIWERNGPGGIQFTRVITDELNYQHIFYNRNEEDIRRKRKGRVAGFQTSDKSKFAILGAYSAALNQRHFINPSRRALEETKAFVFQTGNKVVHSRAEALKSDNPSASGESHGDIVIADALACRGIQEFPKHDPASLEEEIATPERVPWNSPLGRRLAREKKRREAMYW